METEFETQILDIDKEEIIKKLQSLGAREDKEFFMRRWVYDINPTGCSEWLRLRTNGHKTTICYKKRKNHSIDGTSEIEVVVDDFEKTHELISRLNFYCDMYYQENKRVNFYIDDIEFALQDWPMIPTVLEIEAKSKEGVKKGLQLLGLEGKDNGHHGFIAIYKKYGIDLHKMKILKFNQHTIEQK